MSNLGKYDYKPVRAAAILVDATYVAGTILDDTVQYNQLVLEVSFTKGSLTSAQVKVEFLNGIVWSQESNLTPSSGTITVDAAEYSFSATGIYNIPIPIACSAVKVWTKGTGTATGSSMTINAVLGWR